jgi:hypothetical protein
VDVSEFVQSFLAFLVGFPFVAALNGGVLWILLFIFGGGSRIFKHTYLILFGIPYLALLILPFLAFASSDPRQRAGTLGAFVGGSISYLGVRYVRRRLRKGKGPAIGRNTTAG